MRLASRRATLATLCVLTCVACASPAPQSPTLLEDTVTQRFNGYIFITAEGGTQSTWLGNVFDVSRPGPVDVTLTLTSDTDLKFGVHLLSNHQPLLPLPEPAPAPTISGHWDNVPVAEYTVDVGIYDEGKPLNGPLTITGRGTIVYH